MFKRTIVLSVAVFVIAVGTPGVALAVGHDPGESVYLSLGDSLAAGSLANDGGETVYPSNKSYTDRLYKKLKKHVDGDISHIKLGCDGEKTTDMITGAETKCAYVTGTQLGDAMMWLGTGDVVLVTINIGANDINKAAQLCGFDPGCIEAAAGGILANLYGILAALRSTGYDGPIVGMNYYNPNVAASIGFFSGAPGPLAPDPGFAGLTDLLASSFNAGLASIYGLFGAPVADVYGASPQETLATMAANTRRKEMVWPTTPMPSAS